MKKFIFLLVSSFIFANEGLEIDCRLKHSFQACKQLATLTNNNTYKQLAYKALNNSCVNNNANDCYTMAVMCEDGYFKCKSFGFYKKSFNIYKNECNKNNLNSCYELANFYKDGVYVKRNYQKAMQIYKNLCNSKEAKSCYEVSNYYNNESKKYLRQSCKLGFKEACKD